MKLIELTQGKFAKVDDDMFDYLNQWKWQALKMNNNYYAVRSIKINRVSTKIIMHRLIMNVTDSKTFVDHIFHDTLDNQKSQLRICSRTENNRNKTSHKNTTSKYLGVYLDKSPNKWIAKIQVNGKNIRLGSFNNEIDAAKSYNIGSLKYFKEFANLNKF